MITYKTLSDFHDVQVEMLETSKILSNVSAPSSPIHAAIVENNNRSLEMFEGLLVKVRAKLDRIQKKEFILEYESEDLFRRVSSIAFLGAGKSIAEWAVGLRRAVLEAVRDEFFTGKPVLNFALRFVPRVEIADPSMTLTNMDMWVQSSLIGGRFILTFESAADAMLYKLSK